MQTQIIRRYNTPYSAKEKERALLLLKHSTIEYVSHRYHCSQRTIYRWKAMYDGTLQSLENKSSRPMTPHPNSHTIDEIKHIEDLIKHNKNIGLNELYGKLRQDYAYTRHPSSLYRFLKKHDMLKNDKKHNDYKPKPYNTPSKIGEKMQLDVKVVPHTCIANSVQFNKNYYQYTIIDECSRERFIYAYDKQCADNTVDFVRRAIIYFGYIPKIIQTDNGQEFTFHCKTNKAHKFDILCEKLSIEHKLIKPRIPRHNGKVERSHRNDNERFYQYLKLYSLDDLQKRMKAYLIRSNNIPSSVLNWKTPMQVRKDHLSDLF